MFCNFAIKFLTFLLALLSLRGCAGLDKVEVTGDGCKVTEPIYNTTFDLGSLNSDLSHVVNLGKDTVTFNLCAPSSKTCNGTTGVGACLTTKGKEKVLGVDHTLKLSNGRFHFDFTGEKCTSDKNYTLSVVLMCDYTPVKDPFSIERSSSGCEYIVKYRTKIACTSTSSKPLDSCSIPLNAFTTLNLYPLAMVNHVVEDRNGGIFLINICRPVLWDLDAMCPPGTGVCFVNRSETDLTKKFQNMGSIEKPTVEDGIPSVKMTSPQLCSSDTTRNVSSIITFQCDKNARIEKIEFIGYQDCQYEFVWPTSAVCETLEPCSAVDPKSGFKYDLRQLSKKPYNVTHDNHTYTFGVCSAPLAPCLESSGACEIFPSETIGLGIVNDKLLINQTGAPFLKYTGGGMCKKNKEPWHTVIEFVCAEQGMEKGPKIVENTDCRLIIQFVTDAICQEKQISCQTTNSSFDSVIDLTPLIKYTDNYIANISSEIKGDSAKSQYFINVCRPLVPQYGLSCPGGSAICQATIENGKPESEKSLGYPDVSLTMVNTPSGSRAQLKYLRGSQCPADKDTQLSSQINFSCDPKVGRGNPILKTITHDCLYEFEWATNVICPTYKCEFSKKHCSIHNEQTDSDFDLSDLVKSNPKLSEMKFCELDKYQVMADYAQGSVKVFSSIKQKCGDMNIEVRLNCNGDERNSSARDDALCRLLVTYETPSICPMLGLDPPAASPPPSVTTPKSPEDSKDKNSEDVDKSGGGMSRLGVAFIVLVVFGAVGGIGFALKDPERRAKVLSLIRRKNTNVTYSRVSNEEASLLMNPATLTESDDELLI